MFPNNLFRATRGLCLLSFFFLFACQQNEFSVELQYADIKDGRQLPYGAVHRVDLALIDSASVTFRIPEHAPKSSLFAELSMGNSERPLYLLLTKQGERSLYYENLYIDRNKDRDFTNDGPAYKSQGQFLANRNRHYSEFQHVALPYEWREGESLTEEPFLCTFYLWYESNGGFPETGNILRQCWREGSFTYEEQQARVILVDDDCNGFYDTNDRWALFSADSVNGRFVADLRLFRDATRHGWLANNSFEITGISPKGNSIRLKHRELAITREEDFARDIPYPHEAMRPRAARPISWQTDYRKALRLARLHRKNVLIAFCTSWSGLCAKLDERTFSDAEVVALSDNFICLRIDGDTERKLIEQFNIQNYPSLLILDPKAKELARLVGYQPASEYSLFLKQYK